MEGIKNNKEDLMVMAFILTLSNSFLRLTKNTTQIAGVMKVTPLLLFFSHVEMVNNEKFDSKVKYPFQLIFFK